MSGPRVKACSPTSSTLFHGQCSARPRREPARARNRTSRTGFDSLGQATQKAPVSQSSVVSTVEHMGKHSCEVAKA
jgi:hypothetical protein